MLKQRTKGFTLIELLAVIVVLGIVALIVVPNVINTINSAKKSNFKNPIHGLIRAVNTDYQER